MFEKASCGRRSRTRPSTCRAKATMSMRYACGSTPRLPFAVLVTLPPHARVNPRRQLPVNHTRPPCKAMPAPSSVRVKASWRASAAADTTNPPGPIEATGGLLESRRRGYPIASAGGTITRASCVDGGVVVPPCSLTQDAAHAVRPRCAQAPTRARVPAWCVCLPPSSTCPLIAAFADRRAVPLVASRLVRALWEEKTAIRPKGNIPCERCRQSSCVDMVASSTALPEAGRSSLVAIASRSCAPSDPVAEVSE
jgi:hypothetical protein